MPSNNATSSRLRYALYVRSDASIGESAENAL